MTKGCHTCLRLISPEAPMYLFGHTSIENSSTNTITVKDKLLDCIPELLLDSASKGVICEACFTSLRLAYNFKQKCLEAQDKIYGYLQQMPIDTSIDIEQIAKYYKRMELIRVGKEPTSSVKPDVIEISDSDDDTQTHDVKKVDFMYGMSPSAYEYEDVSDDEEPMSPLAYEDVTEDEEPPILKVDLNTKSTNSKSISTDTKTNKVKPPILKVDVDTKSTNSKSKSTDTKTNKVQPPILKVDLNTKSTNSKSKSTDTKTNKVQPPILKVDLNTKSSNSKSESTDTKTNNKVQPPILKVDLNTKSSNSKSESTDTKTNKVQPPILKVDLNTKSSNSKSESTDTKTDEVQPPILKVDLNSKSTNSKSISTDTKTNQVKKENASKSSYQCELCAYSCTMACVFQYHMIVIHYDKSSDQYQCKELNCYFTTALLCRLLDHLAIHMNEHPYLCVECSFSTQLAKVMITHSKLHKQPLCQWKYPEQVQFRETTPEVQAQDLVMEESTEDLLIFKCTLCTLRYESAQELTSHMHSNHSVSVWQ